MSFYNTTNANIYDAYITNSDYGFRYQVNSTGNQFSGEFYVGNNTTCSFQDGTSVTGNQIYNTCTATVGGINITSGQNSIGYLQGLVNDDSVNLNTVNLSSDEILYTDVTDWVNFESPYRAWGKNGNLAEFVDPLNKGSCSNLGSCAMWDGRFVTGALPPKNYKGEAFDPNGNCPDSSDSIFAENVVTDTFTPPRTFLRHATEIVLDGIGNDNGLCETNEHCLWSPNFGAYQGYGDY